VHREGRLVWADALHLENDIADTFAEPACFDGATAQATAIYAGDDAFQHLDLARSLLDDKLRTAATVVNGVLVVRWLGPDPAQLRRAFGKFWAGFRHGSTGRPATLPRLWTI
jgi:urease accessory protein